MFVNKDSIQVKVGNGQYVKLGKYLVEAEYQYNKLWASDSGRNLAGKMTGTLIGIFPKLVLHFRKLKKEELEELAPIFDSATQTVYYYDAGTHRYKTMSTYTGDWSVSNKTIVDDINGHKNEGFTVSFIARSKRT